MSSLIRRMQKAVNRTTGLIHFGDNVGKLANPDAKDLLARLSREAKRNASIACQKENK